jgi:predicted GNAT superfamily acetyltransferase
MSATVPHISESEVQGIMIRGFSRSEEMQACVDLQRRVWGFSDLETVPHRMFVVAFRTGGQVIGAFDGDHAVGFVLGFMAQRHGEIYIHSHMTAVLPEYQNQGIGRRLKLAQRDDALARGFDMIEWTFDPLQLRNAYFNISRLGAIVREYLPNVYGCTSSPLHHGLPTDRLVAQWRIREARVKDALSGEKRQGGVGTERVSLPVNILDICEREPASAMELQSGVRRQFQQLFGQGFAVTDFEISDQTGSYLLQRT